MVEQKYRWDFIGLSTDVKPTSSTSPKVVDGSTFYCSDNSKLYVWCKSQWYERKPLGDVGTSDFEQLTNRPKYNGTAMTGETDIPTVVNTAFTGTDGESAGTAGLVPAPETTDAGKFLKADGSWSDIDNISNYSTSEVNTGAKWVNNKVIYKKSIAMGNLGNSTTTSQAHGISHLETIIKIEGIAYTASSFLPLPHVNPSTLGDAINAYANDTNVTVKTGTDRTSYEAYVTIYYTKSA